jgi:uracil-DNA glycosylase family 4
VFNQLLRAANIDRADCLVTNVFDMKAEENDVRPWMRDPAVYTPQLARLGAEIARYQPRVVVPMGATALWAFTEAENLGEVRGTAFHSPFFSHGHTAPYERLLKLCPIFHPAYVMRVWQMFPTTVADLVRAVALAEEPVDAPIRYSAREVWIEPSLADLERFYADYLLPSSLITIDIETMPKARQITCVGFASDAHRAIVVPFVDGRKPSRSYWPTVELEREAWAWVERMCALPQPKLLQNGTYDTFWLWDRMGIRVVNYREDTRLLHHALYPELPKDLGFMAACYTRQQAWKSWRTRGQRPEKRDE